jgi:transposase
MREEGWGMAAEPSHPGQGCASCVALQQENARLRQENARLQNKVARLHRQVQASQRELRLAMSLIQDLQQEMLQLRRQLDRNSSNSSLPPSASPPSAPPPVPKRATGRKIGAQPGHPGHGRRLLPPEQVDQTIVHAPPTCSHCGTTLARAHRDQQPHARHQVMELPQRAVTITEHQAYACTCPNCGRRTAATLPAELTQSVCGERLAAALCLLSARMHGSRRAVTEVLQEVLGAPLALGSVSAREQELTAALAASYRQLQQHLAAAPVKHLDETGWRRAKRWLWVAAESTCALFHLDAQRGLHGLQRLLGQDDRGNVLQARGIVISDRYGLYDRLPGEQRQLCWAHLKRDFTALAQGPPPQQQWGERLLKLEAAVFALWHQRRRHLPSLRRMLAPLQRRMHRLLLAGRRCQVPGVAGLCQYLLRQEAALWRFAHVPGVAPTNNHAERMLRPAVQWRKQCLGSHSEQGCRFVERMLSAIQSCKLQGRSALQFCQDTLFAYRRGLPTPSLLPAPARTPSDH